MQVAAAVIDQAAEAPAAVRRIAQALVADGRAIVVNPSTFEALAEALGGREAAGRWLSALVVELGAPIVLIVATDGGARSKVICIGLTPPSWDAHDQADYLESLAGELATVAEPLSDTTTRTN